MSQACRKFVTCDKVVPCKSALIVHQRYKGKSIWQHMISNLHNKHFFFLWQLLFPNSLEQDGFRGFYCFSCDVWDMLFDEIMYQSIPKRPILPRAIPGHLTRVKLRTVGNLTQNEARPVGHLTFRVKMSVSGRKQKGFSILWFSRWAAFTGHCSCRFHVGFSVVVVLYSSIVEYAFVSRVEWRIAEQEIGSG